MSEETFEDQRAAVLGNIYGMMEFVLLGGVLDIDTLTALYDSTANITWEEFNETTAE